MRRKSQAGLVRNERLILVALLQLGETWSRPLLDEVDRHRVDDKRTGDGTLLRSASLFESRGWLVTRVRDGRRYYKLTKAGRQLADAIASEDAARAALSDASALVGRLTGAPSGP